MSKHNKDKEVFSKNMSMVILVTMIFIGASLGKIALGSISCYKLNNCYVEFQFRIFKKFY
jgi:hypothetical protein